MMVLPASSSSAYVKTIYRWLARSNIYNFTYTAYPSKLKYFFT